MVFNATGFRRLSLGGGSGRQALDSPLSSEQLQIYAHFLKQKEERIRGFLSAISFFLCGLYETNCRCFL